jgi:hypothetical protein
MGKALTPNKHGLVVVTLTKNYGGNVAGDRAGFLPAIAEQLIATGAAKSFAPAEAQHAVEMELAKREAEAGGAGGEHVIVKKEDADSKGNPTPSGDDAQKELENVEVTTRTFSKSQAKKAGVDPKSAKPKATEKPKAPETPKTDDGK